MYIQSIITHLKQYIMAIANDLRVFGIPIFAINEWKLNLVFLKCLFHWQIQHHEDSFIDYIIIYSDNLNVYLYLNTF